MRVVHGPDGASRVLATSVHTADSMLEKSKGLMFGRSVPDDYALIFRFDRLGPSAQCAGGSSTCCSSGFPRTGLGR